MSRNGSGVYTKAVSSFSPGGTITASDHNNLWDDLVSELTNSVAADGQTSMTGPLKAHAGSKSAPSLTFAVDPDTGVYRSSANEVSIVCSASQVAVFAASAAEIRVPVSFLATASLTIGLQTASIADDAVTYEKLQNVSASDRLLGRYTSGAGNAEEIALGSGVSVSGGTLTLSAQLPRGYIDGCIISNNGSDATNDIDIAAGVCRDSTNAVNITCAAMTGKQLDANWAAGSTAGLRNSGAGIANGTYHIYAVSKADGTQDYYAHTSTTVATVITALQAETGGASYVYARRIGSILRESAAIVAFTQNGDYFERNAVAADINASNPGTSAVTRTLSVPTGIVLEAVVQSGTASGGSTPGYVLLSSLTASDVAASVTNNTGWGNNATSSFGVARIKTNTSAQIRSRLEASAADIALRINTKGWWDARGQDA